MGTYLNFFFCHADGPIGDLTEHTATRVLRRLYRDWPDPYAAGLSPEEMARRDERLCWVHAAPGTLPLLRRWGLEGLEGWTSDDVTSICHFLFDGERLDWWSDYGAADDSQYRASRYGGVAPRLPPIAGALWHHMLWGRRVCFVGPVERELQRAVVAGGDDAAPRLAYAAWLGAQGRDCEALYLESLAACRHVDELPPVFRALDAAWRQIVARPRFGFLAADDVSGSGCDERGYWTLAECRTVAAALDEMPAPRRQESAEQSAEEDDDAIAVAEVKRQVARAIARERGLWFRVV